MARLLPRLAAAWLLAMTLVLPAAAAPQIWVALTETGGAYAEASAVLKAELTGEAELTADGWQDLPKTRGTPPDLVVTVGAAAFEGTLAWLAERGAAWGRVPVLATLLPQAAYEAQLARGQAGRRPVSAAVLDQPIGRQLALLKRTLPERRRVGVLLGPQTQPLLKTLQKEAEARGLVLVAVPVVQTPQALYPALKAVLDEAEVLLALPEPTVYHGASLQNILLTTYRARVPLVAFSSAYVKAGAVLAVYSTPAQVARRTAEMLRNWLGGRGLPAPQMPREFAVSANTKVAASLGLQIDDAALIAEDLRRHESGP